MASFWMQEGKKDTLTAEEKKEAAKLEAVVRSGDYMVFGAALWTIMTKQLYTGLFSVYINKFNIPKHTAYRRVRAYLAAETVRLAGLPVPKNEAIAHALAEADQRNLRTLDSKAIVDIWTQVPKNKTFLSAKDVYAVWRDGAPTTADKLRAGLKQLQAATRKMSDLLRDEKPEAVDRTFLNSLFTTVDAANDLTRRFRMVPNAEVEVIRQEPTEEEVRIRELLESERRRIAHLRPAPAPVENDE